MIINLCLSIANNNFPTANFLAHKLFSFGVVSSGSNKPLMWVQTLIQHSAMVRYRKIRVSVTESISFDFPYAGLFLVSFRSSIDADRGINLVL